MEEGRGGGAKPLLDNVQKEDALWFGSVPLLTILLVMVELVGEGLWLLAFGCWHFLGTSKALQRQRDTKNTPPKSNFGDFLVSVIAQHFMFGGCFCTPVCPT